MREDLEKAFEMKDLGNAKRILGMGIVRDRNAKKLWLMQHSYIKKMLTKFQMIDSRKLLTPTSQHFKLSISQKPASEMERKQMSKVPY